MPKVIDELTPEEQQALLEIGEKYMPLLAKADKEVSQSMKILETTKDQSLIEKANLAIENRFQLSNQYFEKREAILRQAEIRLFDSFSKDPKIIVAMIKAEIPKHIAGHRVFAKAGEIPEEKENKLKISREIDKEIKKLQQAIDFNKKLLKNTPDDAELIKATKEMEESLTTITECYESTTTPLCEMLFSDKVLRDNIKDGFKLYLELLEKEAPEEYKNVWDYIEYCIKNKETIADKYMATSTLDSTVEIPKTRINVTTKAPKLLLTPIDKVSYLAFKGDGALYNSDEKSTGVILNRKTSKKEILSMVSLNYCNDKAIQISGKQELTPYDREVHDALVTLYVDGGNNCITPQMIYKAMTGNPESKLTSKQQTAINNSLNKLMYSHLRINASEEECRAYRFDRFSYESTVIQGEKVAATINGNNVEAYHLLREPVLYTYANLKNQVGRIDIKLLNSPVNKNEENIILQGYLYRRILAMKGSCKLSPTIIYSTIYEQLEIEAASDSALRKKKVKVRSTVRTILDYWKKQNFIKGYVENSRRNEIISVTIQC